MNDAALSLRAHTVHRAFDGVQLPIRVTRGAVTLVIDDAPKLTVGRAGEIIGVDVMVRLVHRDGEEIPVDPHRVIINPPTMHEGRFAPVEAFLSTVFDSVEEYANPEGWGTRGTVTTIYASLDADIVASSATYSTARAMAGATVPNASSTAGAAGQSLSAGVNNIYQYLIAFDTSSIPDTDSVSAVALALDGVASGQTGSTFIVEARVSPWGPTITSADAVAGASLSALTRVATFDGAGYSSGYNTFTEDGPNFQNAIEKTGTTYLLLHSDRQRTGVAPSGNEYILFSTLENAGTTTDPKLTITHAVSMIGTGAATFPALAAAASGTSIQEATGPAVAAFPALMAAASGQVHPLGAAAAVFPALSIVASGSQAFAGAVVAGFAALGVAASGVMQPAGTGVAAFPAIGVSASGAQEHAGAAGASFPAMTAAASGNMQPAGVSAATFPAMTASGLGSHGETIGIGGAMLPGLSATASGVMVPSGGGGAMLPVLTSSATGALETPGAGAASLPAMVAVGTAAQTVPGDGAALLPALSASGQAYLAPIGSAGATLPALVAAGSSTTFMPAATGATTFPMLVAYASGRQGADAYIDLPAVWSHTVSANAEWWPVLSLGAIAGPVELEAEWWPAISLPARSAVVDLTAEWP